VYIYGTLTARTLDASVVPPSQKGYSRSRKVKEMQQGWQDEDAMAGDMTLERNSQGKTR